MVKAKKKPRTASTSSKPKTSESVCIECHSVIDEKIKGIQCEKCGETEGIWKCSECLNISESVFDELVNMTGSNTLHWFCAKCEKVVMKPNDKHDMRIESVLQLLSQAMDRISSLESVIRSTQLSNIEFENKLMSKIGATDNKVQLLTDVIVPPTLDDTMTVNNTIIDDNNHTDEQQSSSSLSGTDEPSHTTSSVPVSVQRSGWSELFHRVSEVAAEVRAVKEATVVSKPSQPDQQQQQQPHKDDEAIIGRSVVVYGLPESRNTNDTLLIDHMIKHLDSSVSVDSHRRLRKKSSPPVVDSSKPPPLMIVLSTVFDRRKVLSLAPTLKSNESYKSVFIKKALTVNELQETTELRKKCAVANEKLSQEDPQLETKFVVIDGKIRRLVRITDTDNYKVDWSKIIQLTELPKN